LLRRGIQTDKNEFKESSIVEIGAVVSCIEVM